MSEPDLTRQVQQRGVSQAFSLGRSSTRQTLQRLLWLRGFAAVIGGLGLLLFQSYSDIDIPGNQIIAIYLAVLVSIALGFWRLSLDWAVSNLELFCHLLIDVFFLVLVLLASGGAGNPLISYLLVLLAVGATFLTPLYANLFAVSGILVYSFFILQDLRLDPSDHMMMDFSLHLIGMWVIFVVSSILIAVFVTRMSKAISERELTLAQAREQEIRNEQLVAIGTLAAGTAHALGTPLSTMAVLLNELEKLPPEKFAAETVREDISILRQQVQRCRDSLSQLTRYYNKENARADAPITLNEFVASIRDYLTNIHPAAPITYLIGDEDRDAGLTADPNLKNAIINIVENSIKAAHSNVTVVFRIDRSTAQMLEVTVSDDGPGLPHEVMENMGEPFISTRKDSMGLGIYLANATIQKAGGHIEMFNRKTGGATTIVRLPLSPQSDESKA
ncbi:MAG: ATP-binding protein [Pseudohongiellaceae bacterium]